MADSGISPHVEQFIHDHLRSVGQLETLLLLQTNPGQAWQPEQIARELRTEALAARDQLELLAQSGLVKRDEKGAYFYAPANDELREAVVGLAQAYLVRRVTVITLIFEKLPEKLRAFSDAFRFRKDPPS